MSCLFYVKPYAWFEICLNQKIFICFFLFALSGRHLYIPSFWLNSSLFFSSWFLWVVQSFWIVQVGLVLHCCLPTWGLGHKFHKQIVRSSPLNSNVFSSWFVGIVRDFELYIQGFFCLFEAEGILRYFSKFCGAWKQTFSRIARTSFSKALEKTASIHHGREGWVRSGDVVCWTVSAPNVTLGTERNPERTVTEDHFLGVALHALDWLFFLGYVPGVTFGNKYILSSEGFYLRFSGNRIQVSFRQVVNPYLQVAWCEVPFLVISYCCLFSWYPTSRLSFWKHKSTFFVSLFSLSLSVSVAFNL